MIQIGLTDHLEGPIDQPSAEVFEEVAGIVRLADALGVSYAWFAEHHAHVHQGHLPTPLLFALYLAGQTKQIQLGTAIICLDIHQPIDVAEQAVVVDLLSNGRTALGFGSGCSEPEQNLFGIAAVTEPQRHARFEKCLQTLMDLWQGHGQPPILPRASRELQGRCWVAANSAAAARIAGTLNFNMLFSHLRTVQDYQHLRSAYHQAGGTRKIAANRPVFVAANDQDAHQIAKPALRQLWRRFQREGKISPQISEPGSIADLAAHPVNFIVGGPDKVAAQICDLHRQVPFDVLNVELRWQGLSSAAIHASLKLLMTEVLPRIGVEPACDGRA